MSDVAQELETEVMAACDSSWRKVAMVISRVLERRKDMVSADEVATAIKTLVSTGALEAQGDLSAWRRCEVRRKV